MTREEIYEFLGWTLKAEPIVGDLSYRIIELVAYAEERTLTNQKARYYQEGYEAGVHDEREECAYLAEMCDDVSIAQFIRARGNDGRE